MSAKMNKAAEENIYLPKVPGESETLWVARNGHSWNIPCGRSVSVPAAVAKILRERDARAEAAKAFERAEAARAARAMTADGTMIRL